MLQSRMSLCAHVVTVALASTLGRWEPDVRADLVSHFPFDEDILDSGPGGNHGTFFGDIDPIFVDGYDGTPGGAILFDGIDDFVRLEHASDLPLSGHPGFSIAMWVSGTGFQNDRRVYSESSTVNNTPLYTLGTHATAANGSIDFFLRPAGTTVNHIQSSGTVFEDAIWHHFAWVDDNGTITLYIDGVPDPGSASFNYARADLLVDMTTFGAVVRDARAPPDCCWYAGAIDDVRLYNHALTQTEVDAILNPDPCPAAATPEFQDTHVTGISVDGPDDGSPGSYTITAVGATDGTGDAILYSFRANDGAGTLLQRNVEGVSTTDLDLGVGTWTVSVQVDDDPVCTDDAPDSIASTSVTVTCPAAGDTTCTNLVVQGPGAGNPPGNYQLTATAADTSGDAILYTFSADNGADPPQVIGPLTGINSLFFTLAPGTWTLSVAVDDTLLCEDAAASTTCSTTVTVVAGAPALVSRFTFDGTLDDAQPSANHGTLVDPDLLGPTYTTGFDDAAPGALALDGLNDYVDVAHSSGLPIYANEAYTVALWVKGIGVGQTDRRVFSESYSEAAAGGLPPPPRNINPLLNIGTNNTGADGTVDIFVRGDNGQTAVNHLHTAREAFDGEWHHIAWVDQDGRAAVYIDGVRDQTNFDYTRIPLNVDRTTIGGIIRQEASHWFAGEIDDVRLYNRALSPAEILALVPEPAGCPGDADTACDSLLVEGPDGNTPGNYTLTAFDATDLSGDPVIHTFTATHPDGDHLQFGPGLDSAAAFRIRKAGTWTFTVKVDDDLLCRDDAPGATCTRVVDVVEPPRKLLLHYKLDGDLLDSSGLGNHGLMSLDQAALEQDPTFVEDRDANPAAALGLDGIDDYVQAEIQEGLPVYGDVTLLAFSVALWVKGPPQPDRRVYSESSSLDTNPLFNLGTQAAGTGGEVDIFIRPGPGHRLSQGIAFDDTWHHIAWVDEAGAAVLYIDGVRDPVDFTYVKPDMSLDIVTVGGILRAAPCCWFQGAIDDVRVYNHALSAEEVLSIVEGGPPEVVFHRGDSNNDGNHNISDPVNSLNVLFLGTGAIPCQDAADSNDDGTVNISDPVNSLNVLFLGTGAIPPPAVPELGACGVDPTDDGIDCEGYEC